MIITYSLGGGTRSGMGIPLVPSMAKSKTYAIARSGVGCSAEVFGGGDTVFTIVDIISQDPTDPGANIFAVIYLIAWWQQNGKMIIKIEVSKIKVDLRKMYSGFVHHEGDYWSICVALAS